MPTPHGLGPQPRRCLFQQRFDFGAGHERQGQERQPAGLGHRQRERGPVADPGHRSLGDRIGQAPGGGQVRAGGQRPGGGGCGQVVGDGFPHRGHDPAGGDVLLGQRMGEGAVLADRQQLGAQVPATQAGRDRDDGLIFGRHRQVGAGVDAVPVDDGGLAAVHRGDGGGGVGAQFGLGGQGQLADRARRPPRRRRWPPPRCAGRCLRLTRRAGRGGVGQELLEQHERVGVADTATGLGTLGDESIGPRPGRLAGFGYIGDLDQNRILARDVRLS